MESDTLLVHDAFSISSKGFCLERNFSWENVAALQLPPVLFVLIWALLLWWRSWFSCSSKFAASKRECARSNTWINKKSVYTVESLSSFDMALRRITKLFLEKCQMWTLSNDYKINILRNEELSDESTQLQYCSSSSRYLCTFMRSEALVAQQSGWTLVQSPLFPSSKFFISN